MDTQETHEAVKDLSELVDHEPHKDARGVYEVGYHILPTVSEDALEAEVNKITDVLKKLDADFVGERFPARVQLSYGIEKVIDGAKRSFDSAYFGWVAFEGSTTVLPKLEEALKAHTNLLRYVVIKTTRDAVAAVMADPGLDVGAPQPEEEASSEEVSEEELDEALENIEEKD